MSNDGVPGDPFHITPVHMHSTLHLSDWHTCLFAGRGGTGRTPAAPEPLLRWESQDTLRTSGPTLRRERFASGWVYLLMPGDIIMRSVYIDVAWHAHRISRFAHELDERVVLLLVQTCSTGYVYAKYRKPYCQILVIFLIGSRFSKILYSMSWYIFDFDLQEV